MERSEFRGRIGRYYWDSEPYWPPETRAPEGAPNVLLIVLDDVGYAQLGCFGSDIATPTFDRLAAGGLRYTNFHTTALCSPTRACVLTGRNHHSCGMGRIVELATGFPGYDARIPQSCGFLPAMLTEKGYAAWAVGKWHLTPEEDTHLGARRDWWPLGRGFERFYGFFPGETSQFSPALAHDNHFVEPPGRPEHGYHLTEDLAERAIEYITDLRHVDPHKPFFCWWATGACHAPHQAPAWHLERYLGQFDDGWDAWREATLARQKASGIVPDHVALSPRPEWVPAWSSLSTDERRVYARYMEAFAAFLTHTDEQVGRIVEFLERIGELDDTLIIAVSDNGASSEGGPTGSLNDVRLWNMLPRSVEEAAERLDEIGGPRIHNNYPWGWTVAGNTPFRRWKRETHEGGVADPLIVHWPARIRGAARGTVRRQYVHAVDIAPTVLEAIGVEAPAVLGGVEQRPLEGTAFGYSFDDADAPERHTTQYYEMFGCRAIYHDGWKAVVYHPIQDERPGLDVAGWELYDVRTDPAECDDLAAAEPDRLREMVDRWWAEAERYDVLPLDNRPFSEFVMDRPVAAPARTSYVYWPGGGPVPEAHAAPTRGRTHTITAFVALGEADAIEGALAVQGSVLGGWSFHVQHGKLAYVHNLSGWREYRVEGTLPPLDAGEHTLAFHFMPGENGGPALGELLVDGAVIGAGDIKRTPLSRYSLTGHGLTVGYATGIPPCDRDYEAPFAFTGRLDRVEIDLEGTTTTDPVATVHEIIASQ